MSFWKRYSKKIIRRDGGKFCHYCGVELMDPTEINELYDTYDSDRANEIINGRSWGTVDHIVPRSKGGSDDLDNMVLACHDCNAVKGAR